jgi:hypothetical protein
MGKKGKRNPIMKAVKGIGQGLANSAKPVLEPIDKPAPPLSEKHQRALDQQRELDGPGS